MNKFTFSFLFLSVLLLSCKKQETVDVKDFAQAETMPVTSTDSSVILSAKVLSEGKDEIIAYGFVLINEYWNLIDTILYDGKPAQEFSMEITRGIFPSRTYAAKAVLVSEKYFVQGNEVTFYSPQNISSVEIIDFMPKAGKVDSLITIRCRNLGYKIHEHSVYLNDRYCEIVQLTDSAIVVKTPNIQKAGNYPLVVYSCGQRDTASVNFELKLPWSYEFYLPWPYDDEYPVCITDSNLFFLDHNHIRIVKLSTGVDKYASSPFWHDDIVSFSAGNRLFFGMGRAYTENFKTLYEYVYAADDWVRKTDFPGNTIIFRDPFVIGDKVYLGPGLRINSGNMVTSFELWEYNTLTDVWTRKADYPGGAGLEGLSCSMNGKGYMSSGYGPDKTIYQYDPASDSWTSLTTYPGKGFGNLTGFALNGKLYIGLGSDKTENQIIDKHNDMWEYDVVANVWKEILPFPENNSCTYSNQQGYVINYDVLMKFNPDAL